MLLLVLLMVGGSLAHHYAHDGVVVLNRQRQVVQSPSFRPQQFIKPFPRQVFIPQDPPQQVLVRQMIQSFEPPQQQVLVPQRPQQPFQPQQSLVPQGLQQPRRVVQMLQQELLRTLPPQTTPLTFSCNPSRIGVDVIRYGRAYHFSWCHDGGRTYTWEEADGYCRGLGHNFQAISIEDQSEDTFINQVLSENPIPWIWTSGHKTYDWFWGTGALLQYNNWSHTGGAGLPQPDNSEGGIENCLGVLKNFYGDGIKWHDIACYHDKPVICETSSTS